MTYIRLQQDSNIAYLSFTEYKSTMNWGNVAIEHNFEYIAKEAIYHVEYNSKNDSFFEEIIDS